MSATSFAYLALDKDGSRRRGRVSALTRHDALRALSVDGLSPIQLRERRPVLASLTARPIRAAEIAAFTRELAVLVEAKIPLGPGLASIAESETNPTLRALILDLAGKIESGSSVTSAVESYAHVLGEVYVGTMRAAEQSGSLAAVATHLAELLDRQQESRAMLRRAMTYPAFVLLAVALALVVILVFVVPRFARVFEGSGIELPLATRIVQGAGLSLRSWWWAYGIGLVGVALAAMSALRTSAGRLAFEAALIRFPLVGRMLGATTTQRFSSVLGISLGSGLGLIESIEVSGRATGRPLFIRECASMVEALRRGEPLSRTLRESRYLPAFARRMLGTGTDSSDLARASRVVAAHYLRESEHLTKGVGAILEPVMTFLLAGVVLVVALSVFLPMWQMVSLRH